jgi:hypothetical protein
MIAWATVDAAVKAAVTTASGVTNARWKWEPSAVRAKQAIDLKRTPVARLGTDERRYVDEGDERIGVQVGQRSFSVEVRCTSDKGSPSDTTPLDSADILSLLMTRIWRPSILDALRMAGVAVSTIGQIVRSDFKVEGREYGLSIVTVTFLVADVDSDSDDYWIETANGTFTVTTPDGSEIATPFSAQVTE